MRRAEAGYPHNFQVDSGVLKDDESESEAKTDNGHWMCLLSVECPHLAWVEHTQRPLLAHYVNTRTHTRMTEREWERRCILTLQICDQSPSKQEICDPHTQPFLKSRVQTVAYPGGWLLTLQNVFILFTGACLSEYLSRNIS